MSGRRCFGSSVGSGSNTRSLTLPGDLEHELGELEHGELVRVADVHRADVVGLEQRAQPLDLVAHEAERTGLLAVAVDGERLAAHRLREEVRHDATVGRAQAGARTC